MEKNKIIEDKFPSLILHSNGFKGENNNCFLDSILSAMFMYTLSPFFIMQTEEQPFRIEIKEFICKLYNNEEPLTTSFRDTINIPLEGQQDASEALVIILEKLEFISPLIHYEEQKIIMSNTETTPRSIVKIIEENIITINVYEHFIDNYNPIIEWFQGYQENCDNDTVMVTTNKVYTADCFIFNIIRYNNTKKINKQIITPDTITIKNVTYFRAAVVCHSGGDSLKSGHYITLFWDGYNNYYKDNDLDNRMLSACHMSNKDYENEINKNGVLFFYYKWYF